MARGACSQSSKRAPCSSRMVPQAHVSWETSEQEIHSRQGVCMARDACSSTEQQESALLVSNPLAADGHGEVLSACTRTGGTNKRSQKQGRSMILTKQHKPVRMHMHMSHEQAFIEASPQHDLDQVARCSRHQRHACRGSSMAFLPENVLAKTLARSNSVETMRKTC